MTPHRSKWTHAAIMAAVTFLGDVGAQLSAGTLSITRAALLGVLVGGMARAAGAYLAARVADAQSADEGEGSPLEPTP